MAVLTVRTLDEDTVRRVRVRAAENGRSAEAEHRETLRAALAGDERASKRRQVAERLAEFRRGIAGCGSQSAAELLEESRAGRSEALMGASDGLGRTGTGDA